MPNYTQNVLKVKGEKPLVRYFYETNRVSKEESELLGKQEVEFSFEKHVSRMSCEFIQKYVEKRLNTPQKSEFLEYDLLREYWGTKWDAMDLSVDLSNIEDGEIVYQFDTAWNYPHHWLVIISKIFSKLDFYIDFTDEDDEYDMQYERHYKNGEMTEIKKYSIFDTTIDDLGGLDKVMEEVIQFLLENDMEYDCDGKKYTFMEYCKMNQGNEELFYEIKEQNEKLKDYVDEKLQHVSHFFWSDTTSKIFCEKMDAKINEPQI